ncbi:MAG: hypothetical protein GF403_07125 [Candidatus Coatesbacteria bacterium]|nr:hypothetical protein [Candidatus Coatesbacteria bacterium]
MRRSPAPLILILALSLSVPARAGAIVGGRCDECGYATDEFFWGRGMDPGAVTLIYRDTTDDGFHTVAFSFVLQHAVEAGLDLDVERDWYEYKTEHLEEILELEEAFSAPDVLGELAVEGGLPVWVSLDAAEGGAMDWVHVDDPFDGEYACPNCGADALVFEQLGWWD